MRVIRSVSRPTMSTLFSKIRAAVPALFIMGLLSACSSTPPYQQEMFDASTNLFSRNFNASSVDACEAARRALLNQGYLTKITAPGAIDATKDFQPTEDKHIQIEFHVVCIPGEETSDTSIVYANAVQNGFALKKSDTTASVGLSILGSVSLPIRSNSDAMVKISAQTIQSHQFYDRFFEFVGRNLLNVVKKVSPAPAADVHSTPLPPPPPASAASALPYT